MKILLIGCNGQVGWELQRTLAPLGEVVSVDYPQIDLCQPDSIRQWMQSARPELVINAAAYTAVDKAETDTETAMKINGVAPGLLAEAARAAGAFLVHYSTDYVYDGCKNTPYLETDPTGPLSAYGRTKLAGDQAIQAVGGNHLVFRLCWVYGVRGQNFLLTMLRLGREREMLRVVNDQWGAPTWARMIAEATTQAVRQLAVKNGWSGMREVYHLCASGTTSWHGFASAIFAHSKPDGRKLQAVEPIPTSGYPTPAKRPAYSVMSCEKLARDFGLRLPDWDHSLKAVLADLNLLAG